MSGCKNSPDKQVAELTWEKDWIGQLAMYGISVSSGGTLESIVDQQATDHSKLAFAPDGRGGMLGYEHYLAMAMGMPTAPMIHVPSHNNMLTTDHNQVDGGVGLPVGINNCQTNGSTSVSATQQATLHGEYGGTSTMPSPENSYYDGSDYIYDDDRGPIAHTKSQKRDRINQRMKILQTMVPNCRKTDKASILDEVIEYLEKLQTENLGMSTINMSSTMMSSTMLPLMQQELQMFMMRTCMRMGMGVIDMNNINCPVVPPVIPSASALMPALSVNSGDCLPTPSTGSVMPDPLVAFLACQSQTITDAYSRPAAMYQQMQQPSTSKP